MARAEMLTGLALSRHNLDRVTEPRREPGFVDGLWADPRARVLVVVEGQVALDGDGSLAYVSPADLPGEPADRYLLGMDGDGVPYFATPGEGPPAGRRMIGLRDIGTTLNDRDAGAFVHALALANWHLAHPHCARCGAPTVSEQGGHLRRCPACSAEHFPRTDPAIIVLVTDEDDRALLGRGVQWPEGRFSTL
ncbi:MAG TPA: NADH pyrophosphatase zinc ribbon domain-containing protein, partial [Actinopolymorphaceae bacterium]